MKKIFSNLIIPAGMLSALIIGAGMFSLPYVFSKSGLFIGFAYLAVFAAVLSAVHLMYAEIIESAGAEHRFVGYAKIYLGRVGYFLSFVTTILGLVFSLLIYLILAAKFIGAIYPQSGTFAVLIFWALATIPILFSITKAGDFSVALTAGMILAVIAIFVSGAGNLSLARFTSFDLSNLYLPFGVVLFSLSGRAAISSVRAYFKDNNLGFANFKKSIVWGTVLPAAVYALFVLGVLGVSNSAVVPDAISGLQNHPALLLVGAILGVLNIWTSYIFLAIELEYIFISDFKIGKFISRGLTALIPLSLYFLGFNNLIKLIGIAGSVFISLESILVALMWNKIKPRGLMTIFASIALVIVFLAAATYELIGFFD